MTTKILATLMLVSSLNFATQVLPSAQMTGGSVLSNSHKEGSLYMMAAKEPDGGGCTKKPC
ncbi:hypothetical protein NIES2111_66770 (plasmid) [Nostoc sp. NIES-2111]|nr:hypothetical protein NIES2111_66770 [Nostoc sp. NIES-2111]